MLQLKRIADFARWCQHRGDVFKFTRKVAAPTDKRVSNHSARYAMHAEPCISHPLNVGLSDRCIKTVLGL